MIDNSPGGVARCSYDIDIGIFVEETIILTKDKVSFLDSFFNITTAKRIFNWNYGPDIALLVRTNWAYVIKRLYDSLGFYLHGLTSFLEERYSFRLLSAISC